MMCLSLGQLAKIISSPSSRTVTRSNLSIIKIKVKITVISNDIHCQVKLYSTFTAVTRFVLYNEKFFTIKLITYFLA